MCATDEESVRVVNAGYNMLFGLFIAIDKKFQHSMRINPHILL